MPLQTDDLRQLAMSASLLLSNCRLYNDPGGGPIDIVVRNGRILSMGKDIEPSGDVRPIDAAGMIVAPGLIDVHIHGAGGGDAISGKSDELETMSSVLAAQGTTGFLATVFAPPSDEHHDLRGVARSVGRLGGAQLLGLHVEGPFLNPLRKGGIPRETIYEVTENNLASILEACGEQLRMMTIAPEMAGNLTVVDLLVELGVVAAFGHSDASYAETLRGFEAGIDHVTHLYNAMRPIHHREPGPIPAILENAAISVQLIADGVHIGDEMLRWTVRQIGLDRCVLVSDGMAGTGLPEGTYMFNGLKYESVGGTARYLDGTLIGTTLGLIGIVRHFHSTTGSTIAEAIDAASLAPARVLGLDGRKGRIEPGLDADLILLDDDLEVAATFVEGLQVYAR